MIMENDKRKILHGMTVMQRLEQGVIDEVQDLLNRGQYLVYLQPKVDIHTGITGGAWHCWSRNVYPGSGAL